MSIPVLHFITELSTGGAQSALLRLLSQLDRTRFTPSVVCLYNGDGAVAKQIRELGITVTDLGMTSKARLDAFGRFYHLLRQERPLILHSWMFHANIPGRVVGRLARVPIIISSERTMGQEGQVRRRLNRLTAPLADRVICVSERVAEFATHEIGIPAQKLVVVPNGIDLTHYSNLPSQAEARAALPSTPRQARRIAGSGHRNLSPKAALRQAFPEPVEGRSTTIVGAIGRPRPVKGYNFLLDAWVQVTQAHPDAHLLFVGDGPDQLALQAQAKQLGLQERVTFLGDQLNIPHLLPALDILALPSLHEGMPNVALEAMAASIPVVATAVGGTPEVVIDGKTGILVPSRDPISLAKALSALINDPIKAKSMGYAGRQRIETHFSLTNTVQQTEALYDALLLERLNLRYEQEKGWLST